MRIQLLALALVFGCGVAAIGQRGATTPTPASPPSGARAPRNAAEFDELFKQVSNWGRWGKDDQLGSANLVTDAKRRQAASLVKNGISVTGGTEFPVNTLATF